jgi:hypothetical protein
VRAWLAIQPAATSDEVHDLRREATALKEVVADLTLENRLPKNVTADGEAANEISGRRKARDHPLVGNPSVGSACAGADRHPEIHILSMVRSLPDWRAEALYIAALGLIGCGTADDVRARIVTLHPRRAGALTSELAVRFTVPSATSCRKPRCIACSRPTT